ncbi:MAG: hypothetical protein ACRDAU_18960 [Clostridium sp.]
MKNIEIKLIPLINSGIKPYTFGDKDYVPTGIAMINAPAVWKKI